MAFSCTNTTDCYSLSWAPPRPGPGGRPRAASPSSVKHTETRRSRSRTGSGRSPAPRSYHRASLSLSCSRNTRIIYRRVCGRTYAENERTRTRKRVRRSVVLDGYAFRSTLHSFRPTDIIYGGHRMLRVVRRPHVGVEQRSSPSRIQLPHHTGGDDAGDIHVV